MGRKRSYIILALAAILPFSAYGQDYSDFRYVDSATYKLYLEGSWNELISEGRKAIRAGTDYKFLRQRLGHACYIRGDYIRSIANLSKALSYDSYDQFTLEYLRYAYLNTGKGSYTGVLEERMNDKTLENAGLEYFRLADHLDLELNYKRVSTLLRSDAYYYRVGLGTRAGHRFDVYQSYATYSQVIRNRLNSDTTAFRIRQPEYYASISWNASRHLIVTGAYHYLHTVSGNILYPGHLLYFAVSPDFQFLNFNIGQSVLITGGSRVFQTGLETTLSLPGRSGFYMKGTLSGIYYEDYFRFVHGAAAGIKLWKGSVLEGFLTGGGLNLYNDFYGLYVYNTYDQISERAGATLYQSAGRKVLLWFNYTYEKKSFLENSLYGYNQFSFVAGLRWKL